MEVDIDTRTHDASQRVATIGEQQDATLNAILTLEAFVREGNWPDSWPNRIRECWLLVLGAARKGVVDSKEEGRDHASLQLKAIQKLEGMIQALSTKQTLVKSVSYADKLRAGLNREARREMPVPLRQAGEVVYAQGGEKVKKTGAEIVQDINSAINEEAAIAARTLPSGDITVTYAASTAKAK
jgi:hypothetical protein